MMPVAPTPVMPTPIKPKIGFSIESLVGQSATSHHSVPREQISPPNLLSPTSSSRPSSSSNASRPSASRSPSPSPSARIEADEVRPRSFSPSNFGGGRSTHHHVARPHAQHHPHHHHPHTQSTPAAHHSPSSAGLRPNVRCDSPPSPVPHNLPPTGNGGGNMGLPNSSIHGPTLSLASSSGPFFDSVNSLKNIYAPEPTYTNGLIPGLAAPQPMSCAPMAHISHHPGIPNFSPLILGNFGGVGPHQLHRDAYPLYPWLLSRQGRFLGHRFQGPDAPAFLLQPFRKPKRIRTAFSPSQLLKLEHAFEKNHYVVGAERKHLAQNLSLTETQVKVWFQNRRTKHKRLKQEEEQSQCSPPSPKKKGSHHLNKWKMETQQSGDENSSGDEQ